MNRFNKTKPLPANVLARAKARELRRMAAMVPDQDRDAAESAVELADAERAAVAAQKMADFADKRPGQRMFSGVKGRVAAAGQALASVKSRVLSLLGISSTPAAVTAPVITGTDPESVEARVAAMLSFDPRVVGRAGTIERVEQIQRFVARVEAIDSTGRVLELVSTGTPAEREASARTIAGILDGLSTPQPPAPVVPSKAAPSAPMGLSGVEAAIAKEIGTARSTSTTTPFRPATVPSKPSAPAPVKPAPVQGGSLSSRLTGSAKAEAAIREEMGLPPKPEHVALADKLSKNPSK